MHKTLQKVRDQVNLILDYIDMMDDSNYHDMADKIIVAANASKLLLEDAEYECKNC